MMLRRQVFSSALRPVRESAATTESHSTTGKHFTEPEVPGPLRSDALHDATSDPRSHEHETPSDKACSDARFRSAILSVMATNAPIEALGDVVGEEVSFECLA